MVDLGAHIQVKEKKPSDRDWFSNAFTCQHCELGYFFDDNDAGYWIRCKPCSRKMQTWQRAKKWRKLIDEKNQFDNVKFITLTIENPKTTAWDETDQDEMKQLIWKPWNKFKRRLLRRESILGGIYAYEYTYDEEEWQADLAGFALSTGDYPNDEGGMYEATISHHPHLHIIAIADYLPQKELLQEWRECVGHERAGVHIKAIPNAGNALGYVTNYITKSGEGSRRREPFGILRGGGIK